MNSHDRLLATAALSLAFLASVYAQAPVPVPAPASAAEAEEPPKDAVLRGDANCTRCHDEEADFPVFAIGKTKHGVTADGRTPTCTDCHGPSETHINIPEGTKERPTPTHVFGAASMTPIVERNGACLTCHSGGTRIHWQTGPHAAADVACTSCHQVHTGHDKVRDKATQTEVCFTCHKELRPQISAHLPPSSEGKV